MRNNPIGVIDSGVGGISVLRQIKRLMPNEDFIYYGDSANAPYGSRSDEEIKFLTEKVVNKLISKKIKTLVIACNTATSAAIEHLRKEFDIPIIGIEPAVKQAVFMEKDGNILVMATEATLRREKFRNLVNVCDTKKQVVSVPCVGLVDLIEKGEVQGIEVERYLNNLLDEYKDSSGIIVLGCTHYPFIKKTLSKIMNKYEIIDGSLGVANELKRILIEKDLVSANKNGNIEILNSKEEEEIYKFCHRLLYEFEI